jgi:hypothetical protein
MYRTVFQRDEVKRETAGELMRVGAGEVAVLGERVPLLMIDSGAGCLRDA